MKNIKLYINYIIIVFIFYSCHGQNNKEEIYFESDRIKFNELEQVRDLILESFEEMDAKFFSKKERSIFKSYVNDFFQLAQDSCIPIYFDNINEGLATLHFNLEKLNFRFLIIRNNFGSFFYIGQTDKYLCYEFLKPYCNDQKDTMILNNSKLKPFSMTKTSNKIKILNKLLNEHMRNESKFTNVYNTEYSNITVEYGNITILIQLLYEIYKFNAPYSNVLQIPDFKFVDNDFKFPDRYHLIGFDYVDYKDIYTGIEYSRDSIGYIQFHKRNFGLFSWKLNYPKKGGDTFYSVEKYFIPSRKIDKKYF